MSQLLYSLALLACPGGHGTDDVDDDARRKPAADVEAVSKQAELTQLQAQIDQLKAEHYYRPH